MDPDTFRREAHRLADWIADYLAGSRKYPVLSRVRPGDIAHALPTAPPAAGESFDAIFADFERVLLPGITHWNHPGFFAYFAITGSGPGVLGEFLSAALNVQAMLWRTSPAATELEEVVLSWLRQLIGLPPAFEGVIYDTASMSTLHALAAAREVAVPAVRAKGLAGRAGVPRLRVYCSDQTHSSIDKAVLLLGLGQESLRKIPSDDEFRMRVDALASAIREDRADGWLPIAAVATVGTTSSTSVDPVAEIGEICRRESMWLHVDAAYAGVAAMVPGYEAILRGAEQADSLVVNPHKWLFTPFDLSAFYCRRMDAVRSAFSLTPEYLKTVEAAPVRNLMDTGIQLGRRFRALKLWMVMRHFGVDGLRARLGEHMRLARLFASWVDESEEFERLAPVPFSVVCFRAVRKGLDEAAIERLNERLLETVNQDGEIFISHTKLHGRFALRLAIGNLHTTDADVARAWELLQARARRF
ncbi:MAG: amino acid decarboxylase [Acidobacteria bacterium RIFCSPLOWO2_02_FULL_67_36]|nr:MAG: amino acid decarboxylase [Acidobacteria bacterium RIFCSPLOWO2_02_FULL_67_36]OFW24375.1 MAG: amino acid decarboxylase [Acidobacteria bacterium RIFCSPLOWO2_12_FULL_66_21]